MTEGPGRWVPKDAFVMPLLPTSLKIDPVVASLVHCVAFLELSGDDAVDPDWAVEAMEHVGAYLQRMSADQAEDVARQLGAIATNARLQKAPPEFVEFLERFLENFGVGGETAEE